MNYGIVAEESWRKPVQAAIKRAVGVNIPIKAVLVSEDMAFLLVPRWALKYNADPRIQIGKRPVRLLHEPLVEYCMDHGAKIIALEVQDD